MKTTQEARLLRQAIEAHDRGRGRRYSPELRARVAAFAAKRRAEGATWKAIAAELGATFETVRRWGRRPSRSSRTALALRPVEVVAKPVASSLAVVALSGLRVEGLTLDDVIVLVRALG